MPRAPMAYAATHLDASARPSSTPMTGISVQNAQRGLSGSIHSHANTRVRGDDEDAGVDVVHRDPALHEEHPVEQREQPDQHGDGAPPEQDPGQQEQERPTVRAPMITPGSRQANG